MYFIVGSIIWMFEVIITNKNEFYKLITIVFALSNIFIIYFVNNFSVRVHFRNPKYKYSKGKEYFGHKNKNY